jgi:hypothetical protein
MKFFEEQPLPDTYETGDTVPRDGVAQCTQYMGARAKVREGSKFGRCIYWNVRRHGMNCRWRYVEALEAIWVGRRAGYVPLRVKGVIGLWAGWHLELPSECVAERHADGSWLAWDSLHVIDVHIVSADRNRGAQDQDPATILHREPNTSGSGWVGCTEDRSEFDDDGPLHCLEVIASAHNTVMACSVAYRDPAERVWADKLVSTITFVPPA